MTAVMAILFAALMLLACPRDAQAYIDPGTGSYVLQIVIGFVLAALFSIKICWTKARHFFTGLFSKTSEENKPNES